MIGPVFHDADRLRAGLLGTKRPVVLDCETTGLDVLRDRVLSIGFRVWDGLRYENHILFTQRCSNSTVRRYVIDDGAVRKALEPLDRLGLIVVGHNLKYDLLMMRREGFRYEGHARDTLAMLRLVDQDRGYSGDGDEGTQKTVGRYDLAAPIGREWLDYRLKNVCAQLLGIKPLTTPATNMQTIGYEEHAVYLAHDLYTCQRLHDYLWSGMSPELRWHWTDIQSPLLHLLCDMKVTGVAGDLEFVREETSNRNELLRKISDEHREKYGISLLGLTSEGLANLVYERHRIPCHYTKTGKPSVSSKVIERLIWVVGNEEIKKSLQLVHAWLLVQSLRDKLNEQAAYLCDDRRFHPSYDNRQAAGRISCTGPNLQQVASEKLILAKTPLATTIRNRNLIVASPGCTLVACDAAQADVRILAHEIDRCRETTSEHRRRLHGERFARLPHNYALWQAAHRFRNHGWRGETAPPIPEFLPRVRSPLVETFQDATEDFYPLVAKTVTGKEIITAADRAIWKVLTLSQINGKAAAGIADELQARYGIECSVEQAKAYMNRFYETFPEIDSWLALQRQRVALAGRTYTWGGRMRTNTAHHWMVNERRVRLVLSFHSGATRWRYYFDVAPVRPTRWNLTCFVHRVWNVCDENGEKPAKLIYDETRGRIGNKWYQHLDKPGFYRLPYRNIAWRSIRYVFKLDRKHRPIERAKYEGLDTTCRQLVNTVMQGGTFDLMAMMMIRARAVCDRHAAKLLIQIHDELVFEVPDDKVDAFVAELRAVCEQPPGPDWRVPIKMEFKTGEAFGSMGEV